MMRSCFILFRVQFSEMFGLYKLFYGDAKEKAKTIGMAAVCLLVGLMFALYSGAATFGYIAMGLGDMAMPALFLVASLVILITTIYKSNGMLFAYKDYDMTISLPVTTEAVVVSRLIPMYLMDLLFTALILLPAGIVYGIMLKPAASFYIYLVLFILTIPVIPLIAACALGAIITAVAIRFRHKNLVMLILSIALVVVIMVGSMNSGNLNAAQFTDINNILLEALYSTYPLSRLFYQGLHGNDLLSVILFILLSVCCAVLFTWLLSRYYKRINTALMAVNTRSNYKHRELKSSSPLMAVYKKELKRLFSSVGYTMNTCISAVMLLLLAVALLFMDTSQLEAYMEIPGFAGGLKSSLIYVVCLCAGMTSTTCVSISLEGKCFPMLLSLPLDNKTIFWGKALVNLTIIVPAILIGDVLILLGVGFIGVDTVFLFLTPIAYVLFTSWFGLVINLCFPVMNWENEMIVIKRSAAVLIAIFGGMLIPVIPIICILAFSMDVSLVSFVFTLIFLLLALLMYKITVRYNILKLMP